jgi:hypothetical protein
MWTMKLLVAFAVLTGIFVDQCDLKDIGLTDFADKVTVTNLSVDSEGWVAVKSNHGQVSMILRAGQSRTVALLAATKYSVVVVGHDADSLRRYTDRLFALRDRLQALTLSSKASPDEVVDAAAELVLLQGSLAQLSSGDGQSCSGKLVADVTSQATIKLNESADGTPFWVIACG